MNADLTDGRCRVVGTRQLLKKLASDEISVLYVAKDAQREITEKLTALAEGNRVEIVTVETMEKLGDMCGIAVGSAAAGAAVNPALVDVTTGGNLNSGEGLVQKMALEGIPSAVIGRTTSGKERILRNGEEVRYLDKPQMDEMYRVGR